MTVQVWDVNTFRSKAQEQAGGDSEWLNAVEQLGQRAHVRGDGLAIYVNNDLGHPEVGEWQVVSYGGTEAQLETRHEQTEELGRPRLFIHGEDYLSRVLPDIGGRINYRYLLEAIVPSYWQIAKAAAEETRVHCPVEGCVYADGHNVEIFPHRIDHDIAARGVISSENGVDVRQPHDRLVALTVKVTGGATELEASEIVQSALNNGLDIWASSGGQAGFSEQDDTGVDTYDRGIRAEVIDAAVI